MSIAGIRQAYRITSVLAATCVGLALAVWWQFNPTSAPGLISRISVARVPPAVELPKPEARVLPTKQMFAAISERFLFHPTRRPPPATPPPAAPLAPAPVVSPSALQPYTLIGIVTSGDFKAALFRTAGSATIIQVVEGEKLQGWTVKRIGEDRVVFRTGPADHIVEFPKESSAPSQFGAGTAVFAQPGLPQPVIPMAPPAPFVPVR